MYLPWIHCQDPAFHVCVCFCWSQTARGIVSCGFGDQDCKLLNLQIKPYDFSHCKPSKKCQPSFCPFSFTTWKVFTALKQRGIGVDDTLHTRFALSFFFPSPVFDLNWCLLDRRGDSRWILPHPSQPLWFSLTTHSAPAGEYITTKAAI